MAEGMMMMLIVGALLIGGVFLLSQNGGLSGLLGGGTPVPEPAPAAEEPKEGEGGEGQEGMEGGEGMEDGMGGMGQGYPYPVPVPVPGYGGPGPRGPPPFGPRPGPPRAGPFIPYRCKYACRFGPSIPCKMCLSGRGGPPHPPGPFPTPYPAVAAARSYPGNAYQYGQTGLNMHRSQRAYERAGAHSRAFYGGCGCGR